MIDDYLKDGETPEAWSLVLCLRRLGGIITKSQLVIDDVVSEAHAALDYNPLLEEVE